MRHLFVLLVCLGMAFSSQAADDIDHYDAVTGLTIKVERTPGDRYTARLSLPTRVVVDLTVDDTTKAVTLRVTRPDKRVGLTREDIDIIKNFAFRMEAEIKAAGIDADSRSADIAESLIGLLSQASAGYRIDTSGHGNPGSASMCQQAGKSATARYTLSDGTVVSKTVGVSDCYVGSALGVAVRAAPAYPATNCGSRKPA